MQEFEYSAPESLAEALRLLASRPGASSLLAGGTDLVVAMRAGRRRPTLIVDVKKLRELAQISTDDGKFAFGAAVPCRKIYGHPVIARHFPALADAARLIGGIQIQGRATVGGNLCNAAPSADTIPSLIAYGATAVVASAAGSRNIPVEDVCVSPGKTCLSDGEILTRLTMTLPPKNSGAMFLRFIPRNEMDIAVVNVGVSVELDDECRTFRTVRVALGAVAPIPLVVKDLAGKMAGQAVNEQSIAEAAQICRAAARPINDMRGTIEHRRQLVKVLVTRALQGAVQRARGIAA
jgi:carbon-monoxide dehydrogenase medium subunit